MQWSIISIVVTSLLGVSGIMVTIYPPHRSRIWLLIGFAILTATSILSGVEVIQENAADAARATTAAAQAQEDTLTAILGGDGVPYIDTLFGTPLLELDGGKPVRDVKIELSDLADDKWSFRVNLTDLQPVRTFLDEPKLHTGEYGISIHTRRITAQEILKVQVGKDGAVYYHLEVFDGHGRKLFTHSGYDGAHGEVEYN